MPTTDSVHLAKFKARAKALQKAARAGDEAAIARIRVYFRDPQQLKLSQAQLVVARELRFDSWRKLAAKQDWVNCSFCGKWQYEIQKLIAGPNGVFVCNECVELCNEIIGQQETS